MVDAGGWLAAGDEGAVLVALPEVPAAEPVAAASFAAPAGFAVEDPELAFFASRFALRSERFDFMSLLVSEPVVAELLSAAVAPVAPVALRDEPAAGLVTGDSPWAFELSGRPPPVSTLRPDCVR